MRAHGGAAYVHLIVDERPEAGARCAHTHAQLYALDFVPAAVARERERFGAYAVRTVGANLLEDLVASEVRRRERIVAIDDEAVLLCPYASQHPFQLMLAPRRRRERFQDDGPTGAALLHKGLTLLRDRFGASPPLSLWVRTAPRGAERFCWRIDIVPRVQPAGGLELGTGLAHNPVAPEQAAAELRAAMLLTPSHTIAPWHASEFYRRRRLPRTQPRHPRNRSQGDRHLRPRAVRLQARLEGRARERRDPADAREHERHPASRRHDPRHLADERLQDRERRGARARHAARARDRRADPDRRRRHARRRAQALRGGLPHGRRPEDDRQRPQRDGLHVRLPDRGADRDRGDRPPALHRRVARSRHRLRGHGPRRGLDRVLRRPRGRRRRHPRARAPVRHRGRLQPPHPPPRDDRQELLDRRRRGGRDARRRRRRGDRRRHRRLVRPRAPRGDRVRAREGDRGAHRLREPRDGPRPHPARRRARRLRPRARLAVRRRRDRRGVQRPSSA